jgi:hypothetical protein
LALLQEAVADDPVALRVLLGLGDNNGRCEAYQKLRQLAEKVGKSERQLLDEAARGVKLPIRVPALIERYKESRKRIASLSIDDPASVVEALFPADDPNTGEIRQIALACLDSAGSLAELKKGLVERITQHDVPESPDFVRIMSLHKSKGLTSPSVIVMGALDGLIPTLFNAETEADVRMMTDEQRRLMYVAITRASEQLVISYFREIEFGLASSLGIQTAKGSTRRRNGSLWARTLATPYLRELGPAAPAPVTGTEWIESYTSIPPSRPTS